MRSWIFYRQKLVKITNNILSKNQIKSLKVSSKLNDNIKIIHRFFYGDDIIVFWDFSE